MLPKEVRSESRTIHPVGHNSDSGSNSQGRRRHPRQQSTILGQVEEIAGSIAAAAAHVMPFLCPMTSPLTFGPLLPSAHLTSRLFFSFRLFFPRVSFSPRSFFFFSGRGRAMYFVAS